MIGGEVQIGCSQRIEDLYMLLRHSFNHIMLFIQITLLFIFHFLVTGFCDLLAIFSHNLEVSQKITWNRLKVLFNVKSASAQS